MTLIVDDKSKDTEIDRATEVIEIKKNYLLNNYTWMSKEERLDRKFRIKLIEENREKLIEKKLGNTIQHKPSLYQPGLMPELEKQLLLDLIDSV